MASGAGRDAADDLTLLQERSAGTFSTVYVAESRSEGGLARIVAVKHLKEQWTGADEVLDRTRDEARLLSRLQHKNILRVEALITLKDRPAVVMEFVDGVDVKQLFSHLADQGLPFPPRAAYRIAASAASALDAAWNQIPYGAQAPLRVVHRDIKPSNLMVSKEGELKVLDFGTARFNHEVRVAHTSMMRFGSLRYMSPERKEGSRGDHSGDIYGLGLLLIELLSGKKCKVLPVEPAAHDAAVAAAVACINDVGLPDERWENTLFETLARMCAYNESDRLTAEQCVTMLRAFADQARGDSLEVLATKVVAPLAEQTYGRLGERPKPSLDPIPTPDPEVPFSPNIADPAAIHRHTTERIQREAGDEDAPQGRADAHGNAEAGSTAGNHPGTAQVPTAAPGSLRRDQRLPQPRPTSPAPRATSTGRVLLLAGLAAFFVVGGLGVAALAIFTYQQNALPDISSEPAPLANTDVASASGSSTVRVQVHSPDSKIRWIKVLDASGDSLGKGRPDTTLNLTPGSYALQVSVFGRQPVSAAFELTDAIDWTCTARQGGGATCSAEDMTLTLLP